MVRFVVEQEPGDATAASMKWFDDEERGGH
jgi:hypothetical protein